MCVCVALYDGGHMTLGLSCAFQIPPAIAAKVMGDEAMDLSEATVAAGYSKTARSARRAASSAR